MKGGGSSSQTTASAQERIAYIGLGSNVGDRVASLCAAAQRLRATPGVRWKPEPWASSLYETSPVDAVDSATTFVNAVVGIRTRLAAPQLLCELHRIEGELGRRRTGRRGECRTIDLDLLVYGMDLIETPDLRVPHAAIADRRFVLEPLSELCPELNVPGHGESIELMARRCRTAHPEQVVVRFANASWPLNDITPDSRTVATAKTSHNS